MSAPAPQAGDVIAGKYRIEQPLGEGGMAVVFSATHLALGRPVALKFVRPWALGENEVRQRFMREAHATFSLRSEHAVRMLDLGELPTGDLFLVMELLEGQNLSEVIQSRKMLPEAEAALYIRQACDALAEAHALGITHRDLKPANLFLTATATGKPCLKVLDFGLAKIAGTTGPGSVAPLTGIATTLGTPKYMAPEQWERAAKVDGRADIYALGVILFQLLTGKVPHEELPLDERLRMILAGAVPSPRGLRPELSETIARVVMRCLRPLPEERFSSAQELANALAYAEAGPAVSRPPPTGLNATGITAVVPDAIRQAVNREVQVRQGQASGAAASVSPNQLAAQAGMVLTSSDDGDAPPTRIGAGSVRHQAPSAAVSASAAAAPGTASPPAHAAGGVQGTAVMPIMAMPAATGPQAAQAVSGPPSTSARDYEPESIRTEKMDRPAFMQDALNSSGPNSERGRGGLDAGGLHRTLMSEGAPVVMAALASNPNVSFAAQPAHAAPPAQPAMGAYPMSANAAPGYPQGTPANTMPGGTASFGPMSAAHFGYQAAAPPTSAVAPAYVPPKKSRVGAVVAISLVALGLLGGVGVGGYFLYSRSPEAPVPQAVTPPVPVATLPLPAVIADGTGAPTPSTRATTSARRSAGAVAPPARVAANADAGTGEVIVTPTPTPAGGGVAPAQGVAPVAPVSSTAPAIATTPAEALAAGGAGTNATRSPPTNASTTPAPAIAPSPSPVPAVPPPSASSPTRAAGPTAAPGKSKKTPQLGL